MSGTAIVRDGLEQANRKLATTNNYFPTTDPAKESDAMGKINRTGVVMVETTLAATLDFYVWSVVSQRWQRPGSNSSDFTKTFGASPAVPAQDYFTGVPGQKYYIKSSAGTNAGADNGEPV